MNKKLVSLSLLVAASMASVPVFAATGTVAKTATAGQISVLSNGSGMPEATSFGLVSGDFPGTLTKTKTLTSVSYAVAAYAGALTDEVQICYYRPYAAAASLCKTVNPGETSSTNNFNSFTFDNGANIRISHKTTGTPGSVLRPSRQESITYNYSY